jgi:hypothetical protein
MVRQVRFALALASAVAVVGVSEARAQFGYGYYPYGYGSYGWGGWGGQTVQGNIARGLGAYNVGAGIYNEDTAVANSINTDTVMRWNEYLFQSQDLANQREHLRMAQREKRDAASGDYIHQRLLKNPSPEDIGSGNALNALLHQVTDPSIHSSVLRMGTDKIPGKVVRAIPFVHASEAVSISLDQLTAEAGWPFALRGEGFAAERKAYSDAIDKALKEDEQGDLSPDTLKHVRDTLATLRTKLKANPPADKIQLAEADSYLRTLLGMSRMLEKPDVEKIVAELDQTKDTTLGHLLGFMQSFNLQFGKAVTPEQRAAYENLYPLVAGFRDRVVKPDDDGKDKDAKATARSADKPLPPPTDFLREMKLHELEGTPPPPKPSDDKK